MDGSGERGDGMSKYTPSPWTAAGDIVTGRDENGMRSPIATISNNWRNREIDRANTHLIAAAPDLLEACQFAYNELHAGRALKNYALLMDKLKDAINKAEGRSNV